MRKRSATEPRNSVENVPIRKQSVVVRDRPPHHTLELPVRKESVIIKDEDKPSHISGIDFVGIIKSRLPIITWLPRYNFALFLQDLLAGFTVGLTEIPQGIAYASVAGLPAQYGMYSGIMGGCMYFVFGSCKDINMGPTAIMALVIQDCVSSMGPDGSALLCFITGLFIFLGGVLHLGFLVEFFSFPIISGFTTAAAISIASTQIKPLLGISGKSSEFLESWESTIEHFSEVRQWDMILGLTTIVCLFLLRQLRVYGSLQHRSDWSRQRNIIGKFVFYLCMGGNALAVVTGTSVAYVADKYYNATPFLLTGSVKAGLPPISLPPFETTWNGIHYGITDMLSQYGITLAFAPMIAFLEHIAIVKSFSKGKVIDATQELLALGIGNMAGSLVHSMPITGSFTRTAVNNASGVRTVTAGLVTCMMLLVSVALLTGVFKYIPKATLAAVITVSMFYLCEFHAAKVLWKTKKLDLIPYLVTITCCLLISLEYGILIGIGTNMLFILYDSARPRLYIEKSIIVDNKVYIVQPKVALHFTSSEYLRQEILKDCIGDDATVVVDGKYVTSVDATIAKSFGDLLEDLVIRNQKLIFWNFSESVINICTGDNQKLLDHFKNDDLENILKAPSQRISTASTER
ncbi:sodium-independent sulfate anion transporter-like [Cylas formicarius]|uniref:sodium-independent sulfate anion transporter-like n=1 Tax=Cylas formicarius TaxID=197179 RepID=UPI0029589E8B|nr:sodium-independent sulfate anion transporter-like [Cylas formicarius]